MSHGIIKRKPDRAGVENSFTWCFRKVISFQVQSFAFSLIAGHKAPLRNKETWIIYFREGDDKTVSKYVRKKGASATMTETTSLSAVISKNNSCFISFETYSKAKVNRNESIPSQYRTRLETLYISHQNDTNIYIYRYIYLDIFNI